MKIMLARLCDIAMVLVGTIIVKRLCIGDSAPNRILHDVFVAMVVEMVVISFPLFGIYLSWRGRPLIVLLLRLLTAWGLVQALACAFVGLLDGMSALSGQWLMRWTLLTAILLVATRLLGYSLLQRFRVAGHDVRRVALVGHGEHFDRLARDFAANGTTGFEVVEVIELQAAQSSEEGSAVGRDVAQMRSLSNAVVREGIQEVWLAIPITAETLLQRCVETLRDTLVDLRFLPDVNALGWNEHGGVVDLVGLPAISLSPLALSREAITGKEVFDRLFAAFALIALAPLMLGIAVCVKRSSPGPVFFRQRRKGLNGRTFSIYKFRTMRVHAPEQGVVRQATRDDPRITCTGRFLRRTSLDELPQFINVLRGEMSVVGPRPHAIEHDEHYRPLIAGYMDRYRVKPGITGWAQVNGHRGETERVEKMAARVEYDLYYLSHWSFALDLRIVFATILRGFIGKQAY